MYITFTFMIIVTLTFVYLFYLPVLYICNLYSSKYFNICNVPSKSLIGRLSGSFSFDILNSSLCQHHGTKIQYLQNHQGENYDDEELLLNENTSLDFGFFL